MNKTIYGVSQLGLRPLTIEFLINGQSRKHTGPLYIHYLNLALCGKYQPDCQKSNVV